MPGQGLARRPRTRPGIGLEAQDQARDWPGGPGPGPGHTSFFHELKSRAFLFSGGGSATPPPSGKKLDFLFIRRGPDPRSAFLAAGPGPPGQPLAWSWASRPIPGLVLGLQASPWPGPGGPSPTQNVGLGPNHQKWPELGPEWTVWPENRSRSMPGPLRSVSDRSRDQKKVKKSG